MKRLWILWLLALAPALPLAAQPEDSSPMDVQAAEVSQEWLRLRDQNELLEIRDPRTAVARYESYYRSRGYQSPSVSVEITSVIAQLYWLELGDRERAVKTYEAAWNKYHWLRDSQRLRREMEYVRAGTLRVPPAVRLRWP